METTTTETALTSQLISIKNKWLPKVNNETDFANFIAEAFECIGQEQAKSVKHELSTPKNKYETIARNGFSLLDMSVILFLREWTGDSTSKPYYISIDWTIELRSTYEEYLTSYHTDASTEILVARITTAYLISFSKAKKYREDNKK